MIRETESFSDKTYVMGKSSLELELGGDHWPVPPTVRSERGTGVVSQRNMEVLLPE